jgi:PIN domain nuclease of toxin-antitoxin system
MKLLLDTHTFIWFVEDDKHLAIKTKRLIEDPDNEIFLSIASLWEMAIKLQLNKLELSHPIEKVIELAIHNGFVFLPILPEHIIALTKLEFFHRDPFDRIIIAQSITGELAIITRDKFFDDYGVDRIWY